MVDTVSLPEWVAYLFDRPVEEPAWHFSIDCDDLEPGPARVAELVAETFERGAELLRPFSDAQLNQGFWYLVSGGGSDYMFCLSDGSVPWPLRRRALRSFVPLFRDVMATRCPPTLSHRDELGATPLNSACYMWWDILPLSERTGVDDRDTLLTDEVLGVLSALLEIPHDACRESAIHGLGHWGLFHTKARELIEAFLADTRGLRPELVVYAEQAKTGCIL